MFQLLSTDAPRTRARRGRLTTAHGLIKTPTSKSVATQGTVKAVSAPDGALEILPTTRTLPPG